MGIFWITIFLVVLTWSGVSPKDTFTWFLEVLPAVIAFGLLVVTRSRFSLTPLLYLLILVHCIILMIGGHYTYAEVPFTGWLDWIEPGRNNYDKVGHFAQGFIPAMVAREILVRNAVINGVYWRNFLIVSVCLAISAFYELLEWWVAVLSEEAADAFLGTQGYVWDTQADMATALIGAIVALTLLGRAHDRQLKAIADSE